jgi:tetratricopeptide (TPR) repeat protein
VRENESTTQVELLRRNAERALRSGDIAEAADAYRQLLSAAPDDADSWFNYAYLQRCMRNFEGAIEAYGKALSLNIRMPEEVLINRAAIFSEHLRQPLEAEAELQKAIAANPQRITARLNLGNLYEDLGDADRAYETYQNVLEISQYQARALARVAAIDVRSGRAVKAIGHLKTAIAAARFNMEDRAEIFFALGNALDAIGAYDEAFEAFSTANRSAYQTIPPSMRYDRERHEKYVDDLITTFPLVATASAAARPPLFILGLFRSGSTLLEQMLARHPFVDANGEVETIPAIVHAMHSFPHQLLNATSEYLDRLHTIYTQENFLCSMTERMKTDKRPDNFLYIGLIKAIFPDAKIIHTVRHPLDTLLSIYFLNFNVSISYGFELLDIAHYIRQHRRLMDHWIRCYGSDIVTVDYDRLVAEPETELRKTLDFVGLDWTPACLNHEAANLVQTASVWQVRQPIHQRSSGRWRNYANYLNPVREALGV